MMRRLPREVLDTAPPALPNAPLDAERARLLALRFHGGQLEPAGGLLIAHVGRVALATPEFARPVAWLHEVIEWTSVAEQELLAAGVSEVELRALRLLNRSTARGSHEGYLAHIEMIARAGGRAGTLARSVKLADLQDRIRHDHRQADGSRLPYEQALELILGALANSGADGTDAAEGAAQRSGPATSRAPSD
jgi:(p)ppGpp synthase/HD superfamily hydrolase